MTRKKNPIIVGNAAAIAVDMFEGCIKEDSCDGGIPVMRGKSKRMAMAASLIKEARNANIPIIVLQERHRKDGIDFGRELDGSEGIHCLEGPDGLKPPVEEIGLTDKDYIVIKRRYSGFFMTDLELLLKALKVETIILVGGLTDVCVHYTFVDGHQLNYHCRVVEDCCYGSSDASHEASLTAMEYLQMGGKQTYKSIMDAIANYKNQNNAQKKCKR